MRTVLDLGPIGPSPVDFNAQCVVARSDKVMGLRLITTSPHRPPSEPITQIEVGSRHTDSPYRLRPVLDTWSVGNGIVTALPNVRSAMPVPCGFNLRWAEPEWVSRARAPASDPASTVPKGFRNWGTAAYRPVRSRLLVGPRSNGQSARGAASVGCQTPGREAPIVGQTWARWSPWRRQSRNQGPMEDNDGRSRSRRNHRGRAANGRVGEVRDARPQRTPRASARTKPNRRPRTTPSRPREYVHGAMQQTKVCRRRPEYLGDAVQQARDTMSEYGEGGIRRCGTMSRGTRGSNR